MHLSMQKNIFFLFATVTGSGNSPSFYDTIDSVSEFSSILQNLWWLIIIIFSIFVLVSALFSIRKRVNRYTKGQIKRLIKNGKYIPGIFVELNESKEVLRYFVYNKKWKKRLVKNFNFVYDNVYGNILKDACNDRVACFHLSKTTSLENIESSVSSALDLHNRLSKGKVAFRPDYEQSRYLFEIIYMPYTDVLEDLQKYSKAAKEKYLVLTGSAGNGKTNLLCSISELLIKLKEAVIFLNSRDIEGDVLEFLFNELELPELYKKHINLYLCMVNLLLAIRHKHLFIIVDAINENDEEEFANRISEFCNKVFRYSRVRVILSCRNEYYKERFRECLIEKVDTPAYEFDLKEQHYTTAALNRIIKAYSEYFNYTGIIYPPVQNVLSKQLLLLRIFFEVYKDSSTDVFSIRKHEIFAQYIETVKRDTGNQIENLLDTLADAMLDKENFDEISLSELEKGGINYNMVKEATDSNILISKKMVSHEGTIARNEMEVVYFVFDEMRDYYLARYILLKNLSPESIDGMAILEKVKKLNEAGASCAEGIIHYIYIFFRTDTVVARLGLSETLCNEILDIYRISEEHEPQSDWQINHREEFQNLGLRIILTSGIPLADFEIFYIQDCLRKDPREDGGTLFDIMLEGTIYVGLYDLDTYLDVLFGLEAEDAILNAFREVIAQNTFDRGFEPEDFITYHRKLATQKPAGALQIQKVAELFLCCFQLNDGYVQAQLEEYFYHLPKHNMVQQEMIARMRKACYLEEKL